MATTKVINDLIDLNATDATKSLKMPSGAAYSGTAAPGMVRNSSEAQSLGSTNVMQHFNGTDWKNYENLPFLPVVSTSAASNVASTSFTANGNLTVLGGAGNVSVGFYIGTDANYLNNTKHTVSTNASIGAYTFNATSLSASTTYYINSFAINTVGEFVASQVTQATNAATAPLASASFIYDPKIITSNGTITSWTDTGSIGRNLALSSGFSKAGTGGSIEYVTSSYAASGRTMFAGSSSTSSTDYSTQQDFTIGTFMNISSSYQTAVAYPYGFTMGPSWGGTSDYANEFVQFTARYGWGSGLDYYSYATFRQGTSAVGSGYTSTQQPYPSWNFICHTVNWSTKTIKMYFNGVLGNTVIATGTPGSTTNIMNLGSSYVSTEAHGGMSFGISFGFMGTEKSASDITDIWNYYKADYGL